MSYTNPKYTYISQQPAFDKLQKDITGAADTIAKKKAAEVKRQEDLLEKEKLKGEKLATATDGATQTYINSTIDAAKDGGGGPQVQGVVTNFFKGKSKGIAQLIMDTTGADAKCKTDGDCEAKYAELKRLQDGPTDVKALIENTLDLLDWKDIENFDSSQNVNALLASNIIGGVTKYGSSDGYSYDLVEAENGKGYDLVFKSTTGEKFVDEDGNETDTYSLNSERLADFVKNDESLFNLTPNELDQETSALQASNIITGATFEDGRMIAGTGDFNPQDFVLLDKNGNLSSESIKSSTTSKGVTTYQLNFDDKLIRDRAQKGIDLGLEMFVGNPAQGIQIKDGKMRTYWNKVLSVKSNNAFDEELARNVWGDEVDVKELKTKWGKVFNNWSTRDPLTAEQIEIFKEMYTRQQVQAIKTTMENHVQNSTRSFKDEFKGTDFDPAKDAVDW
tara:strand:+ start:890 stop:2233 length:1344 start_codon:yes stop_codon:yes gene_type:complete